MYGGRKILLLPFPKFHRTDFSQEGPNWQDDVIGTLTLETLLRYLETQVLILTGVAGNFCVLFTANDAYMRDFNLFVPSDCTVSNTKRENDSALRLMKKFLKADTRLSSKIALYRAKTKRPKPGRP